MDTSIIPAELWDAIFSECKNSPLCLSQICSHLRKTVHANCKLWSVIKINIYKRGLWGGPRDDCVYVRRAQPNMIARYIRLSGTHPITIMLTASGLMSNQYSLQAFELAEESPVLPLVRAALGRCCEFKIEALAGDAFTNAMSHLLRGVTLPMLRDVSFYGSGWNGSSVLELLLNGAADIQRIYFSGSIFKIPIAYLEWAHSIDEAQLGHCWPPSPGHSISDQFPNISNLAIVAGTTFDRRLQNHFGLRIALAGLPQLTSLSLYMNYVSQKHVLEAMKLADVDIPTLEDLSIVYIDPAVQYPVDISVFVHLIHRASLTTLRLLGIPMRSAGFLDLLQPIQPTLRVLIISEPIATIIPYCALSPAFFDQMHDKSFLPKLTSLHLVWNHIVYEISVVDMLEQRAFGAVSVGHGVPFEGMEEDVKRRVLQLNIAYPPILKVLYGPEIS
ncbi:hypothetical protein CPB85DRAFT_1313728 [Mucidula mucida]|nr:hypothetical protein CPB85DRAFT_1313728 [Mucidula mucida]